MKSILKDNLVPNSEDDTIIIVTGLPRCGTSMMMQMLEAGGMQIVTDHVRKPDEDNLRGYYEFEKVKKIKEDPFWLENCYGKAFKMVSALLYYLPENKKYKVIFMRRNMKEMLASQNLMLQRQTGQGDDISDEEMAKKFDKHLQKVESWLTRQSNIEVIYISYNKVIQNPYENARIVCRFLGDWLDVDKMASVVKKTLYRQREKEI